MSGTSSSGPDSWTDLFLHSLGTHEAARKQAEPAGAVPGAPSIPRYEIRERVGEGATAVVFRAWDRELKRSVALKVLRGRAALSPVMRERFHREAQASAGLDHPNVVRVHDAGEHDGDLYLVLEFVSGRPLSQRMAERALPERDAVALLEKVARGMAAAHANGIVHRDLKPGNILVTDSGEPKVGDFGLAYLVDSDARLTRTGSSLGTPLYMSPEQVEGRAREITPRTDVYALGALLYEMLTGRPPVVGETAAEIFRKILDEEPERPRTLRPGIPKDLENIALKALQKNPAARYASAGEVADELTRYLRGEPVLARTQPVWARVWRRASRTRAVWIPAAAAVVLLAVMGVDKLQRNIRISESLITASGLEAEGSIQKARELYLQLVGQDARNPEARRGVERTEQVVKRVQSLLESARPGLERAESALYSPDASMAAFADGVRQAQGPIEEALRLASDYALAHHRSGELWEIQGYYDKAEASWRKARQVDATFAPAHFRLGRILVWRAYQASLSYAGDDIEDRQTEARRRAEEASSEIEAARKESAGFDREVQADVAAAMLAFLRKEGEKVSEICRAAIERHGNRRGGEELWWLQGMVAKTRPEKQRCFNQAILLRPQFPLALYSRALMHSSYGAEDEAIRDYDRVIELCPTFAEAYVNRGSQHFRKKNAAAAIADFETLIRMGQRLGAAYNGRGRCRYELLGDVGGGLADLSEAIRINPGHYLPYQARAALYLNRGDLEQAIADSTRSYELQADLQSLALRCRARFGKGDLAGALEDGRAYLKSAPKEHPAYAEIQKIVDGKK
jgi:serine/threonine-protein kinase